MPMIRSQRIDANGIFIEASDGRTVLISANQITANYSTQIGARAVRRTLTNSWIRQQIQDALGSEQVPVGRVVLDFDDVDGRPTSLEVA